MRKEFYLSKHHNRKRLWTAKVLIGPAENRQEWDEFEKLVTFLKKKFECHFADDDKRFLDVVFQETGVKKGWVIFKMKCQRETFRKKLLKKSFVEINKLERR